MQKQQIVPLRFPGKWCSVITCNPSIAGSCEPILCSEPYFLQISWASVEEDGDNRIDSSSTSCVDFWCLVSDDEVTGLGRLVIEVTQLDDVWPEICHCKTGSLAYDSGGMFSFVQEGIKSAEILVLIAPPFPCAIPFNDENQYPAESAKCNKII